MRDLSSFIDAIRQDGVEAGRQMAAQLLSEAEGKASEIVQEAEVRARRIVAEAEAERERAMARTRADMSLAARNTLIKLREAVATACTKILRRESRDVLAEPDFLATLIRDIVQQYARADAAGSRVVCVTVSEQARAQLAAWTVGRLCDDTAQDGLSLELREGLAGAGLEYRVGGGTVEITPEAVEAVLSEFLSAELAELVACEV